MDSDDVSRIMRVATRGLGMVEHAVYVTLGILLSGATVLALSDVAIELFRGFRDMAGSVAILPIVDRLLFVLLLVEVLHTVRASLQTGGLTPEPFLVVGLIASIRRVLVITLQTSEATKPGGWTAETDALIKGAMLELSVIGALILILVVSLYLLARAKSQAAPSHKTLSPPTIAGGL